MHQAAHSNDAGLAPSWLSLKHAPERARLQYSQLPLKLQLHLHTSNGTAMLLTHVMRDCPRAWLSDPDASGRAEQCCWPCIKLPEPQTDLRARATLVQLAMFESAAASPRE